MFHFLIPRIPQCLDLTSKIPRELLVPQNESIDMPFSFVLSVNVLLKATISFIWTTASLAFFFVLLDGLCLGQPLIQTPYVPTKTHNHAAIHSSYQPGIGASRHHKTPTIEERNSGESATTTTPMQTPSTNLSQSLISARRALLMQQTTDPRSPWLYGRIDRRSYNISHVQSLTALQRPYPNRASLRTLSRLAQRARVGDSTRRLRLSKPTRLWRNRVGLLAEQRLAEEEAEELVDELIVAMRDSDLALVELLARQIGEIANGICKVSAEKAAEKDQRAVLAEREVRAIDSVLGFAMRLRGVRAEGEEWHVG
jgi:hypothetical protein